jgi:hypothetical protein
MLHLVLKDFSPERATELRRDEDAEVFLLTEDNAKEALDKIFAADSVCIWTDLKDK